MTVTTSPHAGGVLGRLALFATLAVLLAQGAHGQAPAAPAPVEMPKNATLEGQPAVRVDSTAASTTRRVLGRAEAADHRLAIKVVDGRIFWASQGDRPLTLDTAGGYTYLSSGPGRYIRLTKLNDRISYVEHLDTEPGHVTFWGELRVVLGK